MNGIVHFWEIPDRNYILLESSYRKKIFQTFLRIAGSKVKTAAELRISKQSLARVMNGGKIKIRTAIKIAKKLSEQLFRVEEIEKRIIWIGPAPGKGIHNPNLPFKFQSRSGARFIAAICNEGWISDGAFYSNLDHGLRSSVKRDALNIFGGNSELIRTYAKKTDCGLSFPSIMRDVLNIITAFKGVKSENNPPIPAFILKNKECMVGWIEQTIADEGHVRYSSSLYRREIIWRRSFAKDLCSYKLFDGEKKILFSLGISFTFYNAGEYSTAHGIRKIRKQIRISKRTNLLQLRKLLRIPHREKDRRFTRMLENFSRYKELPNIRAEIISCCKKTGYVTSPSLKKQLKYKQIGTASHWLQFYAKRGLLRQVSKRTYKIGICGPSPAHYILAEDHKSFKQNSVFTLHGRE